VTGARLKILDTGAFEKFPGEAAKHAAGGMRNKIERGTMNTAGFILLSYLQHSHCGVHHLFIRKPHMTQAPQTLPFMARRSARTRSEYLFHT
jgi:hypothetical protein